MNFVVSIIPHHEQPYNTVGDWRFSDDFKDCYIRISDTGDDAYNYALMVHEMTEVSLLLLKYDPRVAIEIVDEFDMEFERTRTDQFESDPGDDPRAPYHLEHGFATAAERMVIAAAHKNWSRYEARLVELMESYGKK
jgi:hypothetical protein